MDLRQEEKVHGVRNDRRGTVHDTRGMAQKTDQGGPNHLRAWRDFRKLTQQEVADRCVPPTTKQNYQALETGQMQLSAKWLRRLAPAFDTRPGFLLDYDPNDLDSDWVAATGDVPKERRSEAIAILRVLKQPT